MEIFTNGMSYTACGTSATNLVSLAIVLDDEFNHLDTDVSFVGSYEYDTSDVDNRHVTLMVSNDSCTRILPGHAC